MNMNQDRLQRSRLEAIAFGKALREGLMEDVVMRECFSNSPFSKKEYKLQAKMEALSTIRARWRRRWDSNPRDFEKSWFSKPLPWPLGDSSSGAPGKNRTSIAGSANRCSIH